VTLDGSWSGNLYDFYRKVYPKLVADLKIPFEVKGGLRQGDSPVHIALREALANALVHADYRERARTFIVKKKDGYSFTNPGLMRVPPEIAVEGDEPDCRNRNLQAMFRYVNIGEQAGTGLPKIISGWEGQHWRRPSLREIREPSNRTTLEMQMLGLFPERDIENLKLWMELWIDQDFDKLSYIERLALAIAYTEGRLTRSRLAELSTKHVADLSKVLGDMVRNGLLEISGKGRGALYHVAGTITVGPDDVFGKAPLPGERKSTRNVDSNSPNSGPNSPNSASSSPNSGPNSPNSGSISPNSGPNSPNSGPSCPNSGPNSPNLKRDSDGKLQSGYHQIPFIDDLSILSDEVRSELEQLAEEPRNKQRLPPKEMRRVVASLCEGHYITLMVLSKLVQRQPETLRSSYLNPMCKAGELTMAFPDTPNHKRQAYTKGPKA
jgi:hypothetical protein